MILIQHCALRQRVYLAALVKTYLVLSISFGVTPSAFAAPRSANVVEVSQASDLATIRIVYLRALLQELPGRFRALPHRERIAFVSVTGARAVASDIGGRLYLSLDYGQHWIETAVPWKRSIARLERVSLAARVPLDQMPASRGLGTEQAKGEASVRGTVHDPTGAVIPGACLTLIRGSNGIAARQRSDRTGSFIMSEVPSGEYVLHVVAEGFFPYQSAIVLAHSQALVSDVTLSLGNTTVTTVVGGAVRAGSTAAYGWTESQVFEVTLIGGEHWTSPDGLVWSQELQVVEPEPAESAGPPPDTCPLLG